MWKLSRSSRRLNLKTHTMEPKQKFEDGELFNKIVQSIDATELHQMIDGQAESRIVCENAQKKYWIYNAICIAFLGMTILSAFSIISSTTPIPIFTWAVLAISVFMFIRAYNERKFWKSDYTMECQIFNTCETMIKESKKYLYGH